MALEMWASRCGCLHGHTEAEKLMKKREEVGQLVRQCYQRRSGIVMEYQDIFMCPAEELIQTKSPNYLMAWTNMFYALEVHSIRLCSGDKQDRTDTDDDSMQSFDSVDLQEYLIDATDGMNRDLVMADVGAVLTPPMNIEINNNTHGDPIAGNMRIIDSYFGNEELTKRKPPDGDDGEQGND